MNEKAETVSAKMDAPSGLHLNPRPPRSVRVSKRAAGTLMAIAAVILGLFAYGGYKRQQRQVATLAEGSMPHTVAPATAAGAEIAKDVPSGSVPNSPLQRPAAADPGILQPPGDPPAQAGQSANGGQVFVRQAPIPAQPAEVQMPQAREPSPEERRLLAAYEREQQAIAAPTTSREGFGLPSSAGTQQTSAGIHNNGSDDHSADNRDKPEIDEQIVLEHAFLTDTSAGTGVNAAVTAR